MNTPLDVHADAVLFDMDGTLVDSMALVDKMWTVFAREQELDPSDVIAFAQGVPSIDTLRHFVSSGSEVERWFARIARWEHEHFDEVVPIPGAGNVLRSLPDDAWAVVTSAVRAAALARFDAVGFPSPRVLIAADDVTRGKPDPEGYLAAAHALGVDASRCVVFEDTVAGIRAARVAGAQPVVIGGVQHDSMHGLPRLADWRAVRLEQGRDARLRLTTT